MCDWTENLEAWILFLFSLIKGTHFHTRKAGQGRAGRQEIGGQIKETTFDHDKQDEENERASERAKAGGECCKLLKNLEKRIFYNENLKNRTNIADYETQNRLSRMKKFDMFFHS